MIISEFLPNPIGKDQEGEWIELFNNSDNAVNLSGWQIKDASRKTFTFKNQIIAPYEYLVLDYKTTKISLNNDSETLFLYDAKANLVDKAAFTGIASEGKSLIRQNGQFIFTNEPTPGKANKFSEQSEDKTGLNSLPQEKLPQEKLAQEELVALNDFTESQGSQVNGDINLTNLFLGFCLALTLSFVFIFIVKKLNLLSE